MHLRKLLRNAMLEDLFQSPVCPKQSIERIEHIGGSLPTDIAEALTHRRTYLGLVSERADEIAKAFAAVDDDTDPETLPPEVRALHEGMRGDDDKAYRIAAALDEPDADALIYAFCEAWQWEPDRIIGFVFDFADERSSILVRRWLARSALFTSIEDDEGKTLDRIEMLLKRPLTTAELEDRALNECTSLYFFGVTDNESGDGGRHPIMDPAPLMKEWLRSPQRDGPLVRLMAHVLLEWDDELSSESFASLVGLIPD